LKRQGGGGDPHYEKTEGRKIDQKEGVFSEKTGLSKQWTRKGHRSIKYLRRWKGPFEKEKASGKGEGGLKGKSKRGKVDS